MTKKTHQTIIDWTKRSHPYILSVSLLFILISVIVIIFLTFLGYRYAIFEDARPDWEAYATIFSLIAAVGSIWVATYIPSQIAKKQNQIALFDKRFEVYQEFNEFFTQWNMLIKQIIEQKDEPTRIRKCIYAIELCTGRPANFSSIENLNMSEAKELEICILEIHRNKVFLIQKIPSLFHEVEDADVILLVDSYQKVMNDIRHIINLKKIPRGFVKNATEFQKELRSVADAKLMNRIKSELQKLEV